MKGKAKRRPREDRFIRYYKEAAKRAAKISGFPSKDKILIKF